MPATATQLPFVKEETARTGRKLFRALVLPKGKVEHPKHGELDFTAQRLQQVVDRFKAGAMDQVPFLIADADNRHTDDPERFRGEVKGVELADDGLWATIETTDRGAQLLDDNPRLPVSVRLKTQDAGRFKGEEVLAHVLGTLDPVASGTGKWEAIEASGDVDLTDFSAGEFVPSDETPQDSPISTDADTTAKDGLDFSEEEKGVLRKILDRVKGDDKPDEEKDRKDEPTDEEVQEAVRQLIAEAGESEETETETETETEEVAASLSDEDRKAIDMANERAERAELRAGKAELDAKLKGYVKDGVPPAMVEAARDLLSGDETLVELANDREPSAAKKTFEALDKATGTIEFSERGSSAGDDTEDEDAAKERREMAEEAAKGWT